MPFNQTIKAICFLCLLSALCLLSCAIPVNDPYAERPKPKVSATEVVKSFLEALKNEDFKTAYDNIHTFSSDLEGYVSRLELLYENYDMKIIDYRILATQLFKTSAIVVAEVRVDYRPLRTDPIRGADGLEAAAITDMMVRSDTEEFESTPPFMETDSREEMIPEVPMLVSAVVDGDALTLTYNEALDENFVPAADDFAVTAGGEYLDVSEVSVRRDTVTLTLGLAVEEGDVVTVSYAPRESERVDATYRNQYDLRIPKDRWKIIKDSCIENCASAPGAERGGF